MTARVEGLTPQKYYRFKAFTFDVNGKGVESSIVSFMACTPPSGMDIPTIYAIDQTHFTVGCLTPIETGSYSLTGYAVFRDDGLGGALNIPIDPLAI